jgi:hypothetical protein
MTGGYWVARLKRAMTAPSVARSGRVRSTAIRYGRILGIAAGSSHSSRRYFSRLAYLMLPIHQSNFMEAMD